MDSEDEEEHYCCVWDFLRCKQFYRNHTVKENPIECASIVSFWCIAFGILLVFLAFLTGIANPSYKFDTTLPAREMESIEQYYSNLNYGLDICSIIGMGFVTLGGLLMANATVYVMWKSAKSGSGNPYLMPHDFRREDVPLQAYGGKSYGSGAHQRMDSIITPTAPAPPGR